MKKSTIAFLIMFVLSCGMGIFTPYLISRSSAFINPTFCVAGFMMVGLGVAAGWNVRRFFFAPIVPSMLMFVISPFFLGWIDDAFSVVAVVAFAVCAVPMAITALVLYFIRKKRG